MSAVLSRRMFDLTVLITGLGYFVDMFDMFLFNTMRTVSLTELGLSGTALTDAGLLISNCQMAGFLLGAYIAGVIGDKLGRKTSLFLSIIIYSVGTLGSAFVQDVPLYALARFITGMGLAGELGAGLTLIAERLSPQRRGVGTMIFISLGFAGVLCAGILAEFVYWRSAYIIGGAAGLVLLLLRTLLTESGMYQKMPSSMAIRGGLGTIFREFKHLRKYFGAIFLLASYVFIPQILWTLSPEIGKAMGVTEPIKANVIIAIGFSCAIVSDLFACYLSEKLQSRRKATFILWFAGCLVFLKYCLWPVDTLWGFYLANASVGLTFGAWVVTAAWASESFGVNIRSTASTTIPNFARALTIPMNIAYAQLKHIDALTAVFIIGAVIFTLAYIGWRQLPETYGKDLDFYHA